MTGARTSPLRSRTPRRSNQQELSSPAEDRRGPRFAPSLSPGDVVRPPFGRHTVLQIGGGRVLVEDDAGDRWIVARSRLHAAPERRTP